jgi:hypothetical protein
MKIERLFAASSQQDRYESKKDKKGTRIFRFFSEEWITAIEMINRQTTPHLQQQSSKTTLQMVTNDDADNTENEYPLMNEVFTRRPV